MGLTLNVAAEADPAVPTPITHARARAVATTRIPCRLMDNLSAAVRGCFAQNCPVLAMECRLCTPFPEEAGPCRAELRSRVPFVPRVRPWVRPPPPPADVPWVRN